MNFPGKAMVMAAGLGTRMRPLTDHLPKPMIEVDGVTLIDRALDWLAASGISEAVVNSHYMAQVLESHLAARMQPRIIFSREETVLETGGGIKNALPLLGDGPFFCINSDVILIDGAQPALQRLWQAWDDAAMDALLLVQSVEKAVGYDGPGDFFLEAGGALRRRGDSARAPYVFTGVQLLHPRMFAQVSPGVFSMNVLYNRGMQPDGTLSRTLALTHDGDWLHVGDPQGLQQAQQWLAAHP